MRTRFGSYLVRTQVANYHPKTALLLTSLGGPVASRLASSAVAVVLVGLSPCLLAGGEPTEAAAAGQAWVYFGTYTGGASKGIYLSRLDLANGALTPPALAAELQNPSFLVVEPGRRWLYAVGELGDFRGGKGGAVSALVIDPASGGLKLLNQQSSGGNGPCHVIVDAAAKHVLVANYGSGSVAVLPLQADGQLQEPSVMIQHRGSGPNPQRQKGPHAHSINLDAAQRFAFAADLGLDQILIYRFDAERSTLVPHDPPFCAVEPGAGPRHFAFHPSGNFAYVINELQSTLTALAYEPNRGRLRSPQTLSTLPQGFQGQNSTAEVQVHPSGKFVYGSNRGHDSIAVFAVDAASGRLTWVQHQSTQGKTPRNFGIDPSGAWLLAANMDSNSVVVFRIDPATGRLTDTGHQIEVPKPVCVRIVRYP